MPTKRKDSDKLPTKPRTKVKSVKAKGMAAKKATSTASKPKATSRPKKTNTSTRKEVINKSLKKKKIGSNARRVSYSKLGLKQDNTTTGHKRAKSAIKAAGATKLKTAKAKTSAIKKKAADKPKSKAAKLRAKGVVALKNGNTRKAARLRRRYDRKKRK